MGIYNNYGSNSEDAAVKVLKNLVGRGVLFVIMAIIAFFISIHLFSEKSKLMIRADLEVEKAKFENALKSYKARTGSFPELSGNENSLNNIRTPDGKYSFDIFYGDGKIFTVPGNMEKGVEDSNMVVATKDNRGGWVYNKTTGEIKPNVE